MKIIHILDMLLVVLAVKAASPIEGLQERGERRQRLKPFEGVALLNL